MGSSKDDVVFTTGAEGLKRRQRPKLSAQRVRGKKLGLCIESCVRTDIYVRDDGELGKHSEGSVHA